MSKWISVALSWAFLFLTLAPYLALCLFNHPSADDFTYSNWTNFLSQQINCYKELNGRYFTTFVLSLDPLHFHSFAGYKAFTFFLIILFSYSLYAFIKKFMQSFVASDSLIILLIFTGNLFLIFDSAKSLAEGFYWQSGVVCYLLPTSLFLLLTKNLIEIYHDKKYKNIYLCLFLLFCIIGGNEILMLLSDTLVFIILIYQLYQRAQKTLIIISLGLFLLAGVFSSIVVFAPGNTVRALHLSYDQEPYIVSVFSLFTFLSSNIGMLIFNDLKSPFFLSYLVLCGYLFYKTKTKEPCIKFMPFLFLTLVGMALLLFPVGLKENMAPARVLNITNYVFIITIPYLVFCLTKENRIFQSLFIALLFLFIIIFNHIVPVQRGNYFLALNELISGRAFKYNIFLNTRYEFLTHDTSPYEEVPSLSGAPTSLYFADIEANPINWKNADYAIFFGKKAIKRSITDIVVFE